MKVKELIELLSNFNPDIEVRVSGESDISVSSYKSRDCNGPYEVCEVHGHRDYDK